MKTSFFVLFGLVALASMASSGSIEGVIGLALLGKAAVKGAVGAYLLIRLKQMMRNNRGGGMRRYGRSVEDEQSVRDSLLQASVLDENDCAKNFVCQLNAMPTEFMTDVERTVYSTFSSNSTLDVARYEI